MTWEIFIGIVALVGFIGTVGAWIGKLSRTLGILESTIQVLNTTITEFKKNSHGTHEKLFERLTANERTLENHEGRLKTLENQKNKN